MIDVTIDTFHLKDIENEIHPSVFTQHKEYDVFIMRLPHKTKKSFSNESLAFIITPQSYYKYDKSKPEFTDLVDIQGLYSMLNTKIDIAMDLTYELYHKIEKK